MTEDLVAFLRARLDEDERTARWALDAEFPTCGRWDARGPYGDSDRFGNIMSEMHAQIVEEDLLWPHANHIARHDPARVLAEVDAKRRILEQYEASLEQSKKFRQRAASGDETDAQKLQRSTESIRVLVLLKVVKTLALPYADHADYDADYRPERRP